RGDAAGGEPLPRRAGLDPRPDHPHGADDRPRHREPGGARRVARQPAAARGDPRGRGDLRRRPARHGDPRRGAPAAVRGVRARAVLLTGRIGTGRFGSVRFGSRYGRGVSATTLPIPTDDGDLPGLLWLPENLEEPVPGLVVLQEIFGLSPYIRQRCADLAA